MFDFCETASAGCSWTVDAAVAAVAENPILSPATESTLGNDDAGAVTAKREYMAALVSATLRVAECGCCKALCCCDWKPASNDIRDCCGFNRCLLGLGEAQTDVCLVEFSHGVSFCTFVLVKHVN